MRELYRSARESALALGVLLADTGLSHATPRMVTPLILSLSKDEEE